MNQLSTIGFGTDATQLAGYAQSTNDRLGSFTLVVEVPVPLAGSTLGSNAVSVSSGSLYLRIKAHDGITAPSGFYDVVTNPVQVASGGVTSINLVGINSKRIGFFGSGNVKANISVAIRNPAALAGQSIDIVPGPRTGWGFQDGENVSAFRSPGYVALPNTSN